MKPIEENLKQAMNRVDPPEGFAARVMARVNAQSSTEAKPIRRSNSRWLAWWNYLSLHPMPAGAMAFLILVALAVGVGHGRRPAIPSVSERERMEGERVKVQMLLALRITGTELSRLQELLAHPAKGQNHGTPGNEPFSHH